MKKVYKGVGGKGETLWEALFDEDNEGRNCCSTFAKWVEGQQEEYMGEDWDCDRIYHLMWDYENEDVITILKKLGVDTKSMIGCGTPNRNDLKKFKRSRKITTEERKIMKEFYEYFMEDLDGKRGEMAYEKAWDDFNCFIPSDFDKKDDNQVAEYFWINKGKVEVETYIDDMGEEIDAKDVIGECSSCSYPFTKDNLFDFNEGLMEEAKGNFDVEDKDIGMCSNCGEPLGTYEIKDKELKLVLEV